MRGLLFLLLLLLSCENGESPSTGISSNPNFVKGTVINSAGDKTALAKVRVFSIEDGFCFLEDSTLSNEDGEFSIPFVDNGIIEIKTDSDLSLFDVDTLTKEYITTKATSLSSSLEAYSRAIDPEEKYSVVLLNTPYVAELNEDLSYSFAFVPDGTYNIAVVALENDSVLVDIEESITTSAEELKDSVSSVFESIVYIADSTNLIDTYIQTKTGLDFSEQPTDIYSKSTALVLGQADTEEKRILIKPIFHDSIYDLNIESITIEYSFYGIPTDENVDYFRCSTYPILKDWDVDYVSSAYMDEVNTWGDVGIGINNIDASLKSFDIITIDAITMIENRLLLNIPLPTDSENNKGILVVSDVSKEFDFNVSLYSVESLDVFRPIITINYYKD